MPVRTLRTRTTTALCVLAAGAAVTTALAYPVPNPVPSRWEFTFETIEFNTITLPTGRAGAPEAYWYLTYTVTNDTDADRNYAPSFVMYDDQGDLRTSGVSADAMRQILSRLNTPYVEDELSISGMLRRGEANARTGVVAWPVASAKVDTIHIFVGNLSGETAIEVDPLTGDEIVLRKTLALTYEVPGDALARSRAVQLGDPVMTEWIMR
jgi:hypothetical protein